MLNIIPAAAGKGGRRPGSPNKLNRDIREMIFQALEEQGGWRYLYRQASENPVAFMSLVAKIMPTKIEGDAGSSITLHLLAAQLVSEQLLQTQQQPPTLNAEPEQATTNLLNAPLPSE